MATSLLSLLATIADKSPDEIVARLKSKGWLRLETATMEQVQALNGRRVVVGADNGGTSRPFWIVAGSDTNYPFHASSWLSYMGRPCEFWFIPFEESTDGVFPPEYS